MERRCGGGAEASQGNQRAWSHAAVLRADKGHVEAIKALEQLGANKEAKAASPLHVAAFKGHVEVIKVLASSAWTRRRRMRMERRRFTTRQTRGTWRR